MKPEGQTKPTHLPPSPICNPTPSPANKQEETMKINTETAPIDPKGPPSLELPELTITFPNSPTPSEVPSQQPKSPPLIEMPEKMSDFDQEILLDHRSQSRIFLNILKITKPLNKAVYHKFALTLKEEGFIKED